MPLDTESLVKKILEITNNSDYGWIDYDNKEAAQIKELLDKAFKKPFYCQRSIEDEDKCDEQCDHCKGYFKPLENQ